VLVQPSNIRIFNNKEFEEVGAVISEDLSSCDLIVGVKEVAKELLIPNKTYIFFSHVIKAQPYNMPLLDTILDKKIRLLDYEKITDKEGKRLVAFGEFAGLAGAIEFLSGLGDYLLKKNIATPFLNIERPYRYYNLKQAFKQISKVVRKFSSEGIPEELCPLVFGITGTG